MYRNETLIFILGSAVWFQVYAQLQIPVPAESQKPFFVRSLSRAERKAIQKLRKRPPNLAIYRRIQAVHFSSQRLKVQQIAEIVGRSRLTVTRWLVEDIYGDREHVYLFLDNCSIHHTKAVREYIKNHRAGLTVRNVQPYTTIILKRWRIWRKLL